MSGFDLLVRIITSREEQDAYAKGKGMHGGKGQRGPGAKGGRFSEVENVPQRESGLFQVGGKPGMGLGGGGGAKTAPGRRKQ